ncbi:DNA-directed RNA polymerase subunit alpha [Candidatus Roizmanbacteria bacterium RIFCSPLOWO2_01_FULL_44_13]|uniref:DNA-directed RNA polymerase subunit alpha n=1 Tax=Candidatus Roizmanbacteria bacterium RIFCSPLOWO2_01_FULL_44_13 TaxID=1802069 RepID=A0A1F7J9R3_9BACT|nr:MAG: DNA-directed RNA polymerase subunit alpha [Candidatus Roizmanbacteria bacterium RIFCSPLOWO2_01_FULL_44_13]
MLNPNFTTVKTEEGNYGKFVFEPLHQGFGQSLGHALRRTLLSALSGAAITNVKIEGADHLFTTIPGLKESVLDVVLNLKELKFDVSEGGPYKIKINVKGAKKVTAEDVEGELSPVNRDLYIAELSEEKGRLQIEAIVEVGVGYSAVSERDKKEYGFIPVDAFFSPIKKVNIKVEEARVGRKANFDKLTVEIWTDGSTSPESALKEATNLLSNHFSYILSGRDVPAPKSSEGEGQAEKEAIDKKLYEIIIDELNLPSRVINALLREKIETVADLIKAGRPKLMDMKGVGKKSIQLIEEELKKMGIELV